MSSSIENIRAVAEHCRGGEPLPEALAVWLGRSLQSFLEYQTDTLNDAFGLRNARGGIDWRRESSMRQRDFALRQLASEHLAHLSVSAQAERIHQLSIRYGASRWRVDGDLQAMPESYERRPSKWLWAAFKSGAPMPLCARRLRSILAL